jgi:DNA-binding transcriptional ArsR family regulator
MLVALRSGPLCVGQLAAAVEITSSAASYHVMLMRQAGLVVVNRAGRRTLVRLIERRWAAILGALATAE